MVNKYSLAALVLGGATLQHAALAQQAPQAARLPQLELAADGTPTLIRLGAGTKAYAASEARQALMEQLGLKADDGLRAVAAETDELGFTHEKFQQYYRGIRVEHATYTAHARRGAIESLSGTLARVGGVGTTPALAAEAALGRALAFVGARQYAWEAENDAALRPQGELVIVGRQRGLKKGEEAGAPVLAWKFNVYAARPVSRAYLYVNAQTGEIVAKDDIIKHAAATGTFATRYSGTRSGATDSFNGSFRLREATRGLGIETYNCKKGSSYTAAVDFTDADNSWTEYANANFDNAALDAHYGAQSTYDYFKAAHARNSYDNAGAKIKSYVHFDDTPGDGKGYENAYWNGQVMTYGDGATRFDPLTSLDVAAHEIGHAVCSSTANLTYSGESGALNEGFSDIWGAAVEYYKDPAKQTWLIGEDIDKVRPSLRSMSNPNAESQPDTYQGTYWATGTADNGGVHTNSGVLNHWFYRLSVGGAGTNDKGTSFSVSGIGIDAAARIAYRTESVYLTASSNYAAARTYSIQSAKDLYGAGSAQEIAVTNAWSAVGVGAAYGGTTTTPPPTSTAYCASKGTSQAYEFIDYVKLGTLARTSGADAGYYNGTALAAPSIGAGTSQTVSFSAGFPTGSAYTEYWDVYIDYNKNGVFTDAGELIVSGSSSSSATLSGTFTVPATARSGSTRLRVVISSASATTSCNAYSYGETEDYSISITGGAALDGDESALAGPATLGAATSAITATLALFPNPATDHVRLSLSNNAELTSVTVLDARGARVSGARYEGRGELNVSSLAAGMYLIRASDGSKSYQQRFVKQ
ncbi:M4 family metallopeptidase [uncultured Hymenobacter sp.]|uniref:M4 family metallopeptidase n=1 Tax=uncultured Hymenobacter sp. TaxID=170016 RepID=UPI0035C9C0A5